MCLYSPFNSVAAISGKNVFYSTDWRFNEFPNAPTHALYVTCVELLGLPVAPSLVANNLIDVIVSGYAIIPQKDIHSYINAVGIVLAALPEPYWSGIYDRLQDMLNTPNMLNWTYRFNAFELFNFKTVREAMLEKTYAVVLAGLDDIYRPTLDCEFISSLGFQQILSISLHSSSCFNNGHGSSLGAGQAGSVVRGPAAKEPGGLLEAPAESLLATL